jgi:hypothetical protein
MEVVLCDFLPHDSTASIVNRCCALPEAINVLNLVFSLLGGEEARFGELPLLFVGGDEGVVERREKKDVGGEDGGLVEAGETD